MTAPLHQQMAHTQDLPCRNDPAPYFSDSRLDRRYAARCCGTCPLLLECRLYALQTAQAWGVWGGVDMETTHTPNGPHTATQPLPTAP